MDRRHLQPGFAVAVISVVFSAGLLLAGMPWATFLPSALFFGALTWTAFDAGGLPPSERRLQALTRSAV